MTLRQLLRSTQGESPAIDNDVRYMRFSDRMVPGASDVLFPLAVCACVSLWCAACVDWRAPVASLPQKTTQPNNNYSLACTRVTEAQIGHLRCVSSKIAFNQDSIRDARSFRRDAIEPRLFADQHLLQSLPGVGVGASNI